MDIPQFSEHFISERWGFVLERPLVSLPEYFSSWNVIGQHVAEYLENHSLRSHVDDMPLLDHTRLSGYREQRLAYTFLCFIAQGYIWQEGDIGVAKTLPRQLAVPWHGVSRSLGLKTVICHAAAVLGNYNLIDPHGPLTVSNLRAVCTFPEAKASEWFFMVTVITELAAVPGLKAILKAKQAIVHHDSSAFHEQLRVLRQAIHDVKEAFSKMHEGLEASVFYNKVRPFLSGWGEATSAAPGGILFEGVSSEPVKVSGGSAAQSSYMQCFDAALGITHQPDKQAFLTEMKSYMPPAHASFIDRIHNEPSIKNYAMSSSITDVTTAYFECIAALRNLRSYHLQIVAKYIVIMSNQRNRQTDYEAVAKRGTGGQTLMPFLKSLRNTTVVERDQKS